MPDITMCANKKCKLRRNCYRFMAIPDNNYQSYAGFVPDFDEIQKVWDCDNFDPIQKGDRLRSRE